MFGRKRKEQPGSTGPQPGGTDAGEVEAEESGAATDGGPEPGRPAQDGEDPAGSDPASGAFDRTDGPFDADEAGDTSGYLDLGAVRVPGQRDLSVRLDMDPASRKPFALTLLHEAGAVQLRVFAAPRSGGLWERARADILAEFEHARGIARVVDSGFGPEVHGVMPTAGAPGAPPERQPMRIVGVEGPRWLLQGIFYGAGAVPGADAVLEDAFRSVVVVRGDEAMPSGGAIPFTVPPGDPQAAAQPSTSDGPTVESLEPGARITEIR